MTPVAQSVAKDYCPATPEASKAARQFVEDMNGWSQRFKGAKQELFDFVKKEVGVQPRGFISRDPLNMSVFGLMFDRAPGAGFLGVPTPMADDLRSQGLRGDGYFPDTAHPVGKKVLQHLNAVSRLAEQRPLLNKVPGVASMAIEDGRLVLTRAAVTADGVVVMAAAGALQPGAEVKPVDTPAPAATATVTSIARPRPKL